MSPRPMLPDLWQEKGCKQHTLLILESNYFELNYCILSKNFSFHVVSMESQTEAGQPILGTDSHWPERPLCNINIHGPLGHPLLTCRGQ